jgi:protein-tyrosine-phosphatase
MVKKGLSDEGDAHRDTMFGKKKKQKAPEGGNKTSVLFVDEMNDLQSQIAEYFLAKFYPDDYEVRSAGPKHDCIDCELISVMYRNGHDIRKAASKDFNALTMLAEYDRVVFLQQETYDRIHEAIPFKGEQTIKDFDSRSDFKATDEMELEECYLSLINGVAAWVRETFAPPGRS